MNILIGDRECLCAEPIIKCGGRGCRCEICGGRERVEVSLPMTPTPTAKSAREIINEYQALRSIYQSADGLIDTLQAAGFKIIAREEPGWNEHGTNDCTCHPDDSPPRPCMRRYAFSECTAAANSLRAEGMRNAAPPHTPQSLHWLGDIGREKHGCVMYFKDEAECLAFMDWLSKRDAEARAAELEAGEGK